MASKDTTQRVTICPWCIGVLKDRMEHGQLLNGHRKQYAIKGVGNGQVAGPCDPIGLFGSEVQFVPQRVVRDVEAIEAECKDRPLMDLSGVDTPRTDCASEDSA